VVWPFTQKGPFSLVLVLPGAAPENLADIHVRFKL